MGSVPQVVEGQWGAAAYEPSLPLWCFDERQVDPALRQRLAELLQDDASDSRLVCRQCGHTITNLNYGISKGGSHRHTFSNPHGLRFDIGCFIDAPGVRVVGEPVARWSWFSGYHWSVVVCGGCAIHLGWRFSGEDCFFGLILTRLKEQPAD